MSNPVFRKVKEDKEARSTNEILLHPLVIMNVSDHYTRAKFGGKITTGPTKRVVGALFGQQLGRRVEVHTTFELVFQEDSTGQLKIDTAYMKQKKDQYTSVFPNYEVLGWYVTGESIYDSDRQTHKELMQFNETPLLLVVDCEPGKDARALGCYVYETMVEVQGDGSVSHSFQRVGYNIESEESERIGVQNVTQVDSDSTGRSSLIPVCNSMSAAVTMLQSRVQIVIAYLNAVKSGEIPPDQALLRRLSSLCHKLPCAESPQFSQTFSTELQDVDLITYLSLLGKGTSTLNDVIEKNRFAFEKSRRSQQFY